LNDLKWLWQQIGMGHSIGQTVQAGVAGSARLDVLAENFRGLRLKRFLARLEIG
jgi:hypothetical protein